MKHWEVRLSSPDSQIRASGRKILNQAIVDAKAFGGDSVLLVPGKVGGEDETHDHVWNRSIANRSIAEIRKSIPVAARLGVRILIENVWNGFCETPDQLKDYVDEIGSPWVGVYFDIGNARKFAPSEQWIRTLGARIVKLDIKDWGKERRKCRAVTAIGWRTLQNVWNTFWSESESACATSFCDVFNTTLRSRSDQRLSSN